ncbi:unnamed protein product [Calypogeia fissa]
MTSTYASRSISNTAAAIVAATAIGNCNVFTGTVRNGGVSLGNVARLGMKLERRQLKSWVANFISPGMKLGVGTSFSGRRGPQSMKAFRLDGQSSQAGGGFAPAEEEPVKSFQWRDPKNPRICILGGGFGGLYTALRLESLTWAPDKRPQVLLIDQSDRFVFKPMLYEMLSKEVDGWEIAPTFAELLSNTSVKFIKDTVKAVLPYDSRSGNSSQTPESKSTGGTVFLDGGDYVDYDWLVLALGAESKLNLVPGALEFALPFTTLEDALDVDRRLVALERERFGLEDTPIEVVIVGSGYSGVELAATLAERLGKKGKVQLVDPNPDICASAPAGNREAAARVLLSRGVQLDLGYFVTNIKDLVDSGTDFGENDMKSHPRQRKLIVDLKLAQRQTRGSTGGRQLKADLVLWTIGNRATVPSGPNTDYAAFPVNGRGQADTDENLRVKGHPRIFAIGDSAGSKDSSGRLLPTTAQVAFQQADYTGWNLWAAINDRPLLPFRYQHLGEMMTLGTTDAAVTLGFVDNVTLDGLLGHTVRKLAYLYRLPKDDHKVKVALSWLAKSTISYFSFIQDQLTKVASSR